ncbi:hypothetical protein D9M70_523770 [compost metagenome]
MQIPAAANHEFELGNLDCPPADVAVAGAHCVSNLFQRHVLGAQARRIDDDGVLLDETTDARDLGYALGLRGGEAHDPVLQGAQFGQRQLLGDKGVLVDPANTRRVRAEARRDAFGKAVCRRVQVFEHAAARPVGIGSILEDDVDEGDAEEREATNDLRPRYRQHRRR